jgi:hypothetical protein
MADLEPEIFETPEPTPWMEYLPLVTPPPMGNYYYTDSMGIDRYGNMRAMNVDACLEYLGSHWDDYNGVLLQNNQTPIPRAEVHEDIIRSRFGLHNGSVANGTVATSQEEFFRCIYIDYHLAAINNYLIPKYNAPTTTTTQETQTTTTQETVEGFRAPLNEEEEHEEGIRTNAYNIMAGMLQGLAETVHSAWNTTAGATERAVEGVRNIVLTEPTKLLKETGQDILGNALTRPVDKFLQAQTSMFMVLVPLVSILFACFLYIYNEKNTNRRRTRE